MWRYEAGAPVSAAPTVADGTLYAGSDDGWLHALNTDRGERLWRSATGGVTGSPLAVNDGAVYVASADGYLYAFEAASGILLWRFESGAVVNSSLAGGEGAVYFTSSEGYLHAVGASNGELLWGSHAEGSLITSPTAENGAVFAGSSDGHLYAVNAANGEWLWRFHVPFSYPPSLAPPSVVSDVVYFSAQGRSVYAVDVPSGELLWKRNIDEEVVFPPLVVDGKAYVGTYFGSALLLTVLDALSGRLLAKIQVHGEGPATYPAAADGMVYAGRSARMFALEFPFAAPSQARKLVPEVFLENSTSGPSSQNSAVRFLEDSFITANAELVHFDSVFNYVTAIDGVTGEALWCNYLFSDHRHIISSVLGVTDIAVFVGTSAGFLVALDTTSGHRLWQSRLFYPDPHNIQRIGIAIHDGVLYVVSEGHVGAFDATSGEMIWQPAWRQLGAHGWPVHVAGALYVSARDSIEVLDTSNGAPLLRFEVDERVVSSPVVADGTLYIVSKQGVHALDSRSGELRWRYDHRFILDSFVQLTEGTLIVTDYKEIYALDASTGTLRWHEDSFGPTLSRPVVAAGVVYIPSEPHSLYALDAQTGAVRWQYLSPVRVYSDARVVAVVEEIVYFSVSDKLYALDAVSGEPVDARPQEQATVPSN